MFRKPVCCTRECKDLRDTQELLAFHTHHNCCCMGYCCSTQARVRSSNSAHVQAHNSNQWALRNILAQVHCCNLVSHRTRARSFQGCSLNSHCNLRVPPPGCGTLQFIRGQLHRANYRTVDRTSYTRMEFR